MNNNSTLEQEQRIICSKYNSPYSFCSENEKVGIAIDTMDKQPIYGVRHERENGTCGWYIWGGEYADDEDFFQPVHFSHIESIVPDYVLKYLALATGYNFIVDENGYEDVWFEEKMR